MYEDISDTGLEDERIFEDISEDESSTVTSNKYEDISDTEENLDANNQKLEQPEQLILHVDDSLNSLNNKRPLSPNDELVSQPLDSELQAMKKLKIDTSTTQQNDSKDENIASMTEITKPQSSAYATSDVCQDRSVAEKDVNKDDNNILSSEKYSTTSGLEDISGDEENVENKSDRDIQEKEEHASIEASQGFDCDLIEEVNKQVDCSGVQGITESQGSQGFECEFNAVTNTNENSHQHVNAEKEISATSSNVEENVFKEDVVNENTLIKSTATDIGESSPNKIASTEHTIKTTTDESMSVEEDNEYNDSGSECDAIDSIIQDSSWVVSSEYKESDMLDKADKENTDTTSNQTENEDKENTDTTSNQTEIEDTENTAITAKQTDGGDTSDNENIFERIDEVLNSFEESNPSLN